MKNIGQFGQAALTQAFHLQNVAISQVIELKRQKSIRDAAKRRAREKLASDERLSAAEHSFREKELSQKFSVSKRRDILFKQIAIYSIMSIGAMAVIITGGVLLLKRKKGT